MSNMKYVYVTYIGNDPKLEAVKNETGISYDGNNTDFMGVQFDRTFPYSHSWTNIPIADLIIREPPNFGTDFFLIF